MHPILAGQDTLIKVTQPLQVMDKKTKMHDSKKEVPMRYKLSIKKTEIVNIKVQCTSASGAAVKEEILKHSGKDSMEHYLMCMKQFNTIAKRYNWWITGPVVQANVNLVFKMISRILPDEPLETWEDECTIRPTKNKANFDKNSEILTKFVCGKDAYDTQENYLKFTKKPDDMTM
eukprot:15364642-Ditylum_brightwellii.AAC.1